MHTTQTQDSEKSIFVRIFAVVFLPMLLAAVDQTLLAAATPVIVRSLGHIELSSWIVIGYLLSSTASVALYGWLGDRYGRRNMLMIALSVFGLGSAAATLASSMQVLIVTRIIQGLGAGGLMSLSQAIIGESIAPRARARYQGYFSSLFVLASLIGPLFGGVITTFLSWRFLFLLQLPLIAFAIYKLTKIENITQKESNKKIDFIGLMIFPMMSTVSLYWLSMVGHGFSLQSTMSIILVLAFLGILTIFVYQQLKTEHSFLPWHLLQQKVIYKPLISSFLFAFCLFALIFYLPIYLQLGIGYSVFLSGLLLLPILTGQITGAYMTGKTIAKTAVPKWPPVIGMSFTTLGFASLAYFSPSPLFIILFGVLTGFGLGTVMPSTQLLIQTIAGRDFLASITSCAGLVRGLGAAIGTATFGGFVYTRLPTLNLKTMSLETLQQHSTEIIQAFQMMFAFCAVIAALCVLNAMTVPKVNLDDIEF